MGDNGDNHPSLLEDLDASTSSDQSSTLASAADDEPNIELGDKLLPIKIQHKHIINEIIRTHGPPETERLKRILGEYFRGDSYLYISLCPINGDIQNAFACIEGPNLSPYEGGIFWLHVYFPANYPSYPPKMRFLTPICHPDIDGNGDFYLKELSLEEDGYVPHLLTRDIIWSIFDLLDEPDFKEFEFEKTCISDFDEFLKKAESCTRKYAMVDEPDETKLVKDWLEHFDQQPEAVQGSDTQETDQETDDDASPNATVETCRVALINWRQQIWETRKEDQFKDIEFIIPDSAIITISTNLDRLFTNEIQLEQLDMEEWDARTQFLEDESDSSLRQLLKNVCDHCVNIVVQQLEKEREDAMRVTMIDKHEQTWNPMWFR